jgi:hypothetical protein
MAIAPSGNALLRGDWLVIVSEKDNEHSLPHGDQELRLWSALRLSGSIPREIEILSFNYNIVGALEWRDWQAGRGRPVGQFQKRNQWLRLP